MRLPRRVNLAYWSVSLGIVAMILFGVGTAIADTVDSSSATTTSVTDTSAIDTTASSSPVETSMSGSDGQDVSASTTVATSSTSAVVSDEDTSTSSISLLNSTSTDLEDEAQTTGTISTSTSESTPVVRANATSSALDTSIGTTTGAVSVLGNATSSASTATSTSGTSVTLECPMSYTADLYDTPSGHLDAGYVLDAASNNEKTARRIGTQSWEVCHDDQNHTFEFKIGTDEYSSFGQPGARMEDQSVNEAHGPTQQAAQQVQAAAPLGVSSGGWADLALANAHNREHDRGQH